MDKIIWGIAGFLLGGMGAFIYLKIKGFPAEKK